MLSLRIRALPWHAASRKTEPHGDVRVEVENKGKGIPPRKRSKMESAGMDGVGIRGMRERIRQLGGA